MSEEEPELPETTSTTEGDPLYNFFIQFIDVMTQRGAIKGDELLQVGTVRQEILNRIEALK